MKNQGVVALAGAVERRAHAADHVVEELDHGVASGLDVLHAALLGAQWRGLEADRCEPLLHRQVGVAEQGRGHKPKDSSS